MSEEIPISKRVSTIRFIGANKIATVEAKAERDDLNTTGCCSCCRRSSSILKDPMHALPKQSLREYFEAKLADGDIEPSSVAIILDNMSQFSYKDLNEISNCFASIIQNKLGENFNNNNLDNDIVIGLCLPPALKFHVPIVFAIVKLGATYFPINSKYSEELIFNLWNEAQPVLTIISSEDASTMHKFDQMKLFGGGGLILTVEDLTTSLSSEGYSKIPPVVVLGSKNPKYPKAKDRTVVIIPSTNSAGIYTGVRYQSHSIFTLVLWTNMEFLFEKGETVLSLFSMAPECVEAVKEIFSTLFSGSTLVILPPEVITHPTVLMDKIKSYNVRRLVIWPRFLLNMLWTMEILGLQNGNSLLSSVKYYICVGDSITVELAKMFFQYVKPNKKLSVYGQDEDLSAVAFQVYDSLETVEKLDYFNNLPVGQPIMNMKLYIVSPTMTLVKNGVVGEICISGEELSEQYGRSEAPPPNLSKNPFSKSEEFKFLLSTGDFGRIVQSKDGEKRLIFDSSSEKNIHLEEHFFSLEEIASHVKGMKDWVTDFHVMFYQVGNDTQSLILFCCLKHPADMSKVRENLASKLPPFAMPDLIVVEGEKLPLERGSNDVTRQVNKKTLLTLYENERAKRKDGKHLKNLNLTSVEERQAAQVLLLIIANLMYVPLKLMVAKLSSSFRAFGGSNFKSVMIIRELHKNRYPITIDEFIQSKSLMEIILKMVEKRAARGVVELDIFGLSVSDNYHLEEMTKEHKDDIIAVLSHSFTMKDELEYYSSMTPKLIEKLLLKQWSQFVEQPLSLTLRRLQDKKIVGGILCVDRNNRKHLRKLSTPINYKVELQNFLEETYMQQHLQNSNKIAVKAVKGKSFKNKEEKPFQIVHFGVLNNLFTFEGLHQITKEMITEAIIVAKNNHFNTVLISVLDFYVAEICEQDLGFTLVKTCQANMFTAEDNSQPYANAPDWLECKFVMKKL